jgi:hypothetical protein
MSIFEMSLYILYNILYLFFNFYTAFSVNKKASRSSMCFTPALRGFLTLYPSTSGTVRLPVGISTIL